MSHLLDELELPVVEGSLVPSQLHRVGGQVDGPKNETLIMRHAAYMAANGYSPGQIAAEVSRTRTTIYKWLKTPWFQELATQIMHEHGGRDITAFFKGSAFDAAATLHQIMMDPLAKNSDRQTSAIEILNRAYGKPVQPTESPKLEPVEDVVAEVARLEAQLGLSERSGAMEADGLDTDNSAFAESNESPTGRFAEQRG